MRLKAGDMLHFLVRKEVAGRIPDLIDRLRRPVAAPTIAGRERGDSWFGRLSTEPWTRGHGDPSDPISCLAPSSLSACSTGATVAVPWCGSRMVGTP